MKQSILGLLAAVTTLAINACSSPADSTSPAPDAATPDASPAADSSTLADAAAPDASPEPDASITWTTKVLVPFEPSKGQLPEGLTIHDNSAYAGFAPLGQIVKADLAKGTFAPYGTVPAPVAGKGFMTGLSFAADGALYAALVSFDPSVQPGIYRIAPSGGAATLFAKDAKMVFPNGLLFDTNGNLFVTDSAAGAIYKIDSAGVVTPWATSALLTGDQNACGGSGNGFDIGANGLAAKDDYLYATNTDKGAVLRFKVNADGSAGAAEPVFGPDCDALSGADGMIFDQDGRGWIAINRQNKIARIGASGDLETIVANGDIDFPASLDWNGATLVATSFAFANAVGGKPAHPSLVAVDSK